MKQLIFILCSVVLGTTISAQVEGWASKDYKVKWSNEEGLVENPRGFVTKIQLSESELYVFQNFGNSTCQVLKINEKGEFKISNTIELKDLVSTRLHDFQFVKRIGSKIYLIVRETTFKSSIVVEKKFVAFQFIPSSLSFDNKPIEVAKTEMFNIEFQTPKIDFFYAKDSTELICAFVSVENNLKEANYNFVRFDENMTKVYEKKVPIEDENIFKDRKVKDFSQCLNKDESISFFVNGIELNAKGGESEFFSSLMGQFNERTKTLKADVLLSRNKGGGRNPIYQVEDERYVIEIRLDIKKDIDLKLKKGFLIKRIDVKQMKVVREEFMEFDEDFINLYAAQKGVNFNIEMFEKFENGDYCIIGKEFMYNIWVFRISKDFKIVSQAKIPRREMDKGAYGTTEDALMLSKNELFVMYLNHPDNTADKTSGFKMYESHVKQSVAVLYRFSPKKSPERIDLFNNVLNREFLLIPPFSFVYNNKLYVLVKKEKKSYFGIVDLK